MRIKAKVWHEVEYVLKLQQREGRDTRGFNWLSSEEGDEAMRKILSFLQRRNDVSLDHRIYGVEEHPVSGNPGRFVVTHGMKLPLATRQTKMKYVYRLAQDMADSLNMDGIWLPDKSRGAKVGEMTVTEAIGDLDLTFDFQVHPDGSVSFERLVDSVENMSGTYGGNYIDLKDFSATHFDEENGHPVFEGTARVPLKHKYLDGSKLDTEWLAEDIDDTLHGSIRSLTPARGSSIEDLSSVRFRPARTASQQRGVQDQLIRLGEEKPDLRPHIAPVLDVVTGRFSKSAADMKPVFKQITDYSDGLADKAQTHLRKHPELTAHRVKPGEGMERVTVKSDRTKACVCFGVDASDVHNIKHVCIIKINGEKVKRKSFAPELGEDELVDMSVQLMLDQLGL